MVAPAVYHVGARAGAAIAAQTWEGVARFPAFARRANSKSVIRPAMHDVAADELSPIGRASEAHSISGFGANVPEKPEEHRQQMRSMERTPA